MNLTNSLTGCNLSKLNNISIYPNPTASNIYYDFKTDASYQYNIIDLTGNILLSGTLSKEENNINLSSINNGLYLVTIIDDNNNLRTDKISMQH